MKMQQKVAIYEPGIELSLETLTLPDLILDFPVSRTERKCISVVQAIHLWYFVTTKHLMCILSCNPHNNLINWF